jgi:hypothetical protein
VDKRTGFRSSQPLAQPPTAQPEPQPDTRSTGHAYYADQARRALGVTRELRILPRVPAPVFHGMVGVGVAAMAVLARPQIVGARRGVILDLLLAAVTALAIVYYDRLVCPPGARPGLEAGLLPAAALLSEAVVLASTDDAGAVVAAVPLAAMVMAVTPHLRALRAAGQEGWLQRLLGELIRVVVLLPVCLVGASSLVTWQRLALVAAGAGAVAYDALSAGDEPRHVARLRLLAGALLTGGAVAVAAVFAGTSSSQPGAAAGLLAIWHGAQGIVGHLGVNQVQRWAALEYAAFVAAGAVALQFSR